MPRNLKRRTFNGYRYRHPQAWTGGGVISASSPQFSENVLEVVNGQTDYEQVVADVLELEFGPIDLTLNDAPIPEDYLVVVQDELNF